MNALEDRVDVLSCIQGCCDVGLVDAGLEQVAQRRGCTLILHLDRRARHLLRRDHVRPAESAVVPELGQRIGHCALPLADLLQVQKEVVILVVVAALADDGCIARGSALVIPPVVVLDALATRRVAVRTGELRHHGRPLHLNTGG